MTYSEVILNISSNLLVYFDEVYHSAEITVNDKGEKIPATSIGGNYIDLSFTDQRETIYIRRNGDDEVQEDLKLSSCGKGYKMKTQLRIVYARDHIEKQEEILSKLMQAVLIGGTKLNRIIQDKWKLQKEESSGDYNFGATTAYFAIDIYALWTLQPDTCEQDFCIDIANPLKKESCPVAV